MKVLSILLLLVYAASPLSGHAIPGDTTATKAAPSISLTEIKSADAGNAFYYLTCAAKTANDKPTA